MSEAVEIAVKKAKLKLSDLLIISSRTKANDRIITAVAKKLGFPKEKIFIKSTVMAICLLLRLPSHFNEAVEKKKIKKGKIVVLVAFGSGLVSALMW